jgi:auxin-responsive protein IAA
MGEAAEASKTLHNWMGEPGQGDRDDEEKTLQLSLGLPGGGGGPAAAWRAPGREKGSHSAAGSSMLSLGYSNAAFSPCSQGMLYHLWIAAPWFSSDSSSFHVKCCSWSGWLVALHNELPEC